VAFFAATYVWVTLDRGVTLFRYHQAVTALGAGLTVLGVAVIFAYSKRRSLPGGQKMEKSDHVNRRVERLGQVMSALLVLLWVILSHTVDRFRSNFGLTLLCSGLSAILGSILFLYMTRRLKQ
jgi:uncharacterized membrane protein